MPVTSITAQATTAICPTGCVLKSIIGQGASTATVAVKDGADTLVTLTLPTTATVLDLDLPIKTSLSIVTATANPNIAVVWESLASM